MMYSTSAKTTVFTYVWVQGKFSWFVVLLPPLDKKQELYYFSINLLAWENPTHQNYLIAWQMYSRSSYK